MSNKIGIVYGETSTDKFTFLFHKDKISSLKNSFIYIKDNKNKIVGKVIDIFVENPLLNLETMKFFAEDSEIGREISKYIKSEKFMFYTAESEVLGILDEEKEELFPLTKPVETGTEVYLLEANSLEKLFFDNKRYNLFPGYIEAPTKFEKKQPRFSLKGDEIITMHCGIFGMTGMGKTTTTGTLLEELTIRGVKSLIFDPHGDYINLGILKKELEEKISKNFDKKILENFKHYLTKKWEFDTFEPKDFIEEEMKKEMERELKNDSIFFRLLMIKSVLKGEVINIDNIDNIIKDLNKFYQKVTLIDLERQIPEEILSRLLKLRLSVYPSIEFNPKDYNKYYLLNLISAFSGEEVSDAQEGIYDFLFNNLSKLNKNLKNLNFLKELINILDKNYKSNKSKGGNKTNPSYFPVKRQLEKAINVVDTLEKKGVKPLNSKEFIKNFSKKNGEFSIISNVVFDLTEISPEIMQRGLLYDIMQISFDLYKSKEISFEKNDYQLLFVIEEARVLIPKSGVEEFDHPATKGARNIVRRVATEGRKMGLGLVIVSQKPSAVDNLPVSQCNTLILHRVINPEDLAFVKSVGESISEEDIENLKQVERGVSIVTGTALKIRKSLMVKFRNRLSKEGREHPQPLKQIWGNK